MASMKTMMLVLMTIFFGLLFISQSSYAEIYKWVDEKGGVHFTEDPATIPEKYRDNVKNRKTEEDLMSPMERAKERTRDEKELMRQQVRENQAIGVEEPKVKQPNKTMRPVRSTFDPTQDQDYQEMLNILNKGQYYQRDYYYPHSQRIMHRKGDLNRQAAETAANLKEKLDELVRDPRYESSSEYKKQVKEFFKNHFHEKDEYHSRSGSVMREKGEIKTQGGGIHTKTSTPRRDDNQVSNPSAGIKMPRDIYNPLTGYTLKDQGDNHYFDPQTGQHWYPGYGGTYNPATGNYLIDNGDTFLDPKTGQTWQKR